MPKGKLTTHETNRGGTEDAWSSSSHGILGSGGGEGQMAGGPSARWVAFKTRYQRCMEQKMLNIRTGL